MAIPKSAKELFDTLGTLNQQKNEADIAFAIAGAIYIASWKSGLLKDKGVLDDTLFFKFSSCIDNKLRPDRTLLKLSGVFLNFAKDKVSSKVAVQALQVLVESIDKVFSGSNQEQINLLMKALLHVRDASYVYIVYSSELAKRYQLKKENGTKEDLNSLINKT